MTTLSDLRTQVAADLRDAAFDTWTSDEIDDLINQGIDAVGDVYPRQIVQTIGTVSASVSSCSASAFRYVFRLDIYTSAGSYDGEMPHAISGADSGWEFHNGIIYLPPNWMPDAGDTLRAWGYGSYVQLSSSTSTTDLDTSAQNAVRVFCQAEGFHRLIASRVAYQQWQSQSANTDVTALALNQIAFNASRRWETEKARLRGRGFRRLG